MGRFKYHIYLFLFAAIQGGAYTVLKLIVPSDIGPYGAALFRIAVGASLFWAFSSRGQAVERSDRIKLLTSGLMGTSVNILLFYKGMEITSPINGALILTSTPIFVFVLSVLTKREAFSWIRCLGILFGLIGVLVLLIPKVGEAGVSWGGDLLVLANALLFASYIVYTKPMFEKYDSQVALKWVMLSGAVICFPFGINELVAVDWLGLSWVSILSLLYISVLATYVAFNLTASALKTLSGSVFGAYVYLQPVVASFVSFAVGMDTWGWDKPVSAMAIFAGVFLVSKRPAVKAKLD